MTGIGGQGICQVLMDDPYVVVEVFTTKNIYIHGNEYFSLCSCGKIPQ